jgi:transposase
VRYNAQSARISRSELKMKAYSLDLRQKIIDLYNQGNLSQRQLAKQFNVALSFIQKILKQYRQTGEIAPKVRIKQTPTKLNPEQIKILQELVNSNKYATLEELRHKLASATGVVISRSTVDRMLSRMNFTLKKNTTRYRKRYRKSTKATVRILENC